MPRSENVLDQFFWWRANITNLKEFDYIKDQAKEIIFWDIVDSKKLKRYKDKIGWIA